MKANYISLNRKILDWRWYNKPNTCRLFIHILLKANFKDKTWEDIIIKRGTFVTSADILANELGLTRQNVRTSLKHLVKTKEIKILTNSKYSLITVNKYDTYQIVSEGNQRLTSDQPTANQRLTTTNNVNNANNENNVVVGTEKIYESCVQDDIWLEHLMMRNKMNKKQVVDCMKEFTMFLKDKGEVTADVKRFKSGFAGFLRKKENYKKRNRHDDITM